MQTTRTTVHATLPVRACAWGLATLATLTLFAAHPRAAAAGPPVALSGPHDHQAADGYDASGPGAYVVPADTAVGPSATFNDNGNIGLVALNSGVVTIYGGQFDGNANLGLLADTQGSISVYGGEFSGNGHDLFVNHGGTIDLYGQFDGLTPGETKVLGPGTTSFHGTLEDDTVAQTFTYDYSKSGAVTLHDLAAAPEPSAIAGLALGSLGLAWLGFKARKRRAGVL